jgi:TIR domain
VAAPKAFVSYSYDSPEHKAWVLKLAMDLRTNGVDVTLDQWDLKPGQDMAAFMADGVAKSDRVLLICSENYVRRAEKGSGGVGYERLVITSELVSDIDTRKFLPVMRNSSARRLPNFLGPRLYVDFTADAEYSVKLEEILRDLHAAPALEKPPLGQSPFSSTPSAETPTRAGSAPGLTQTGKQVLDDEWFATQTVTALEGMEKLAITGSMELRFALHEPINKSQIELLAAVRSSQIRTFGWPIAVTLDTNEYRAKPVEDGIQAEIAIPRRMQSGRPAYDFWHLRENGDFFLLHDLFEDHRAEKKLFFDTRIVRVTESILFCSNLYRNLGVDEATRVGLRVTHRGLKGRELVAATPNRHIFPATTSADTSRSQFVDSVGQLVPRLIDHVIQLTEPLFMLFDFKKFDRVVYEELVNHFVAGRTS